jgi:hypothetical protein
LDEEEKNDSQVISFVRIGPSNPRGSGALTSYPPQFYFILFFGRLWNFSWGRGKKKDKNWKLMKKKKKKKNSLKQIRNIQNRVVVYNRLYSGVV